MKDQELGVAGFARRLKQLYESAVALMIPHATTDVLGDHKRLRRQIGSRVGPANGHPFHQQFLDALIDEATAQLENGCEQSASDCMHLQACPFCGEMPQYDYIGNEEHLVYRILHECTQIEHSFRILGTSSQDVLTRWNTRQ